MIEKNKLFQITERDISERCDALSLSKGKNYFQNKMIYDAYLINDILQSKCMGSMQVDYSIKIRFSKNGIEEYQCSCPRGGFCKHIVALLLVYIKDFESIHVINTVNLKETLKDKSREKLIEIIENLLKQNPDLINFLELINVPEKIEHKNLEELISKHRKLADNCFRGYYEKPYYASFGAGEKLGQLISQANTVKDNEKITAIAIFTAIFESIDENMNMIDDSDGVVGGVANECIDELIKIVPKSSLEIEIRQKWQKTMFNYLISNDYGIGDGLDILLLESCKKEDINFLKNLAQEELNIIPQKDDFHNEYFKKQLCNFIANLYEKDEKSEMALELYKEHQLHFEYVKELFNLNQVENAFDYAQKYLTKGYDIFRFAETLIENNYIDKAHDFIQWAINNLNKNEPYYESLFEKLALVYEKKNDWNSACKIHLDIFKKSPNVNKFKKLEEASKKINKWETIKNEAIEYLITKKEHAELVEIYLWLGEVQLAIEFLKKHKGKKPYFYYGVDDLAIRVAKSAEKLNQEEAINIYKEESEKLICDGNRSRYQEAVIYLKQIKKLSKEDDFEKYLTNLMLIHKKRRAFLDEIKKIF